LADPGWFPMTDGPLPSFLMDMDGVLVHEE
jgi:hypothetical protein